MGAVVGRPRQIATKTKRGLGRLSQELHAENWAPRADARAQGPDERGPAPANRRADSEDEDGDVDDMVGALPAGLELAAGYDSSSDEETDVGSVAKLTRVRKLMERPVDDAGAGKKIPDKEIRAMLYEANRSCQRLTMSKFVQECTERLNHDDEMDQIRAGVRCSASPSLRGHNGLCCLLLVLPLPRSLSRASRPHEWRFK